MWVILHTAGTGFLALAVLLLCRWRRLGPAARHALWLLVLLKLLAPPLVSWPLPRLPFDWPGTAKQAVEETAPMDDSMPSENLSRDMLLSAIVAEDSSLRPVVSAPVDEDISLRERWTEAAVAVWLCGGLAVAFVQLRRLVKMRQELRHARPASPWLVAQVEELASVLGVRAPRLAVLPGLASPFLWAGSRVCLLWPEDLEKHLSPEGCRAVLVHELAHLSRRDHWVGRLLVVAGCMWWWHPLFYLIRRPLHRQAELACDALVIAAMPDARRSYAEALLDVCQRQSWTDAATPALGVAGRRRDLERRLVMIMRANVPGRLTARGLVGIALVGVIALPAWTLGRGDSKPAPTDRDKQLQSLENKLKEVLKDLEAQRKAPSPVVGDYTLTRPVNKEQELFSVVLDVAKVDERDKKLQELEAKVKALLKEVQALRSSNTKTIVRQGVDLVDLDNDSYLNVLITEVVKPAAPTEVALTRTTYKLPAAKAEALGKFLQQHVKASVMETKVEGESLIVTTTPEVQRGIGQFINLIEGRTPPRQSKANQFENNFRQLAK